MDESREAENIAALQRVAQKFAEVVYPVVEVIEGSGRREHVGSVTVVEFWGAFYAVTAEHVIKNPAPRYVLGETKGVAVPSTYRRLRDLEGVDLDVAYWRIDPTHMHEAGITVAFRWTDEQGEISFQPEGLYVAMGHPVSRSKLRNAHQSLHTQCMVVTMNELPLDQGEALGFDTAKQLVLQYDRGAASTPEGISVTGAKPSGMSGGAVFYPIHSSTNPGELDLVWGGIITEHHPKKGNAFVATRARLLAEAVRLLE